MPTLSLLTSTSWAVSSLLALRQFILGVEAQVMEGTGGPHAYTFFTYLNIVGSESFVCLT